MHFPGKMSDPFRLPEKSNTPPVHFRLLSGWRWGESAFRSVYNSGCCGVMDFIVDILHSEGFPSWVGVSSEVADLRSSSFFCCLGECVHWFTRTHFFPRVDAAERWKRRRCPAPRSNILLFPKFIFRPSEANIFQPVVARLRPHSLCCVPQLPPPPNKTLGLFFWSVI